jgi:hypothetical protein
MAARRRAAIHEASHACACRVLGLPVIKVTIADGGAYLQRGCYQQQPDLAVECLSIMALAGSEGERLFFSGDGDDYYGDKIDLAMVRRYLQPRSELEFVAEIARLRAAARRLVMASRHQIEVSAITTP